jgi:hypothetical protein
MPKSTPARLASQRLYNARPEQIKKREMNNAARYAALKMGVVHKGDKKEVDHINPLRSGGSNASSNTRVIPESQNAAWRKGRKGAL